MASAVAAPVRGYFSVTGPNVSLASFERQHAHGRNGLGGASPQPETLRPGWACGSHSDGHRRPPAKLNKVNLRDDKSSVHVRHVLLRLSPGDARCTSSRSCRPCPAWTKKGALSGWTSSYREHGIGRGISLRDGLAGASAGGWSNGVNGGGCHPVPWTTGAGQGPGRQGRRQQDHALRVQPLPGAAS
jgi:hypothetical protein